MVGRVVVSTRTCPTGKGIKKSINCVGIGNVHMQTEPSTVKPCVVATTHNNQNKMARNEYSFDSQIVISKVILVPNISDTEFVKTFYFHVFTFFSFFFLFVKQRIKRQFTTWGKFDYTDAPFVFTFINF